MTHVGVEGRINLCVISFHLKVSYRFVCLLSIYYSETTQIDDYSTIAFLPHF